MSAYVEHKAHIDALVTLAVRGPEGTGGDPGASWTSYGPRWLSATGEWVRADHVGGRADLVSGEQLGQLLWDENRTSVAYRYRETAETVPYVWPFGSRRLSAVDGLAAISGYEYQSCEHPGWEQSEAYRFCVALRLALCGVLSRESDCWSISA